MDVMGPSPTGAGHTAHAIRGRRPDQQSTTPKERPAASRQFYGRPYRGSVGPWMGRMGHEWGHLSSPVPLPVIDDPAR